MAKQIPTSNETFQAFEGFIQCQNKNIFLIPPRAFWDNLTYPFLPTWMKRLDGAWDIFWILFWPSKILYRHCASTWSVFKILNQWHIAYRNYKLHLVFVLQAKSLTTWLQLFSMSLCFVLMTIVYLLNHWDTLLATFRQRKKNGVVIKSVIQFSIYLYLRR